MIIETEELDLDNFGNIRLGRCKTLQDIKDMTSAVSENDMYIFDKKEGTVFFFVKQGNLSCFYNRAGNQLKLVEHLFPNGEVVTIPDNTALICKSTKENVYFIDLIIFKKENVANLPFRDRRKIIMDNFPNNVEPDCCKKDLPDRFIVRDANKPLVLFSREEGIGCDFSYTQFSEREDFIVKDYYVNQQREAKDYIFNAYQYERNRLVRRGKLRIQNKHARAKAIQASDKGHRIVCTCIKNGKRNVNLDFVKFKSGKPFKSVVSRFSKDLVFIPVITRGKNK